MKKTLALCTPALLAAVLILSLGCGSPQNGSEGSPEASSPIVESGSSSVLQADHITIDGVFVDNSYVDDESDALKAVYVFGTVSTDDQNLSVSSAAAHMIIGADGDNPGNDYSSEVIPGIADYMKSYYYSSFLEDVYVGEDLKTLWTFKVPKGDLVPGKSVSLSDSHIPDIDQISFTTDEIVTLDNQIDIATSIDPEGYEAEMYAREDADEETVWRVQSAINNMEYWGSARGISYRISFSEPNSFELTQPLHNYGTYTVKNGYVELYYPESGTTALIPYSWKDDGSIDMDFSVFLGLF